MLKKGCTLLSAVLAFSLLVACASPQEKSLKFISKGKDLFEKTEYDKARLEFKNAIQLDPKSAEAHYRLGLVQLRLENLKEAFGLFRKAEELDGGHAGAKVEMAKLLVAGGDIDKAREKIESVLGKDPADVSALLVQAAIQLHENKTDEALAVLRTLQEGAVGKQDLYVLRSAAYQKKLDDGMVEKTLVEGVEKASEKGVLMLMLVEHYVSSNKPDLAIAVLEKHIAQNPGQRGLRFRLADLLWKNGQQDKARSIVDETVAQAGKDTGDVVTDAALFLDSRGDKEKARNIAREALYKAPEDFKPRFLLAEFHLADGKRDQAIALLEEGLPLVKDPADPRVLETQNRLGEIHLLGNEPDRAETRVSAVLKESPKNIDANFLMGRIHLARGEGEQAIMALRMVVAERPLFLAGHLELANAHIKNKELGQALQVLAKAEEFFPKDPELMRKTAAVNLMKGDRNAARQITEKLSALFPDDLKARDLLGQFATGEQEPAKASAIYEDIIKKEPGSPLGYIRLAQLRLLQGDDSGAEQALRNGLKKIPESVELFTPLVRLNFELGKKDAAEQLCRDRLARLPGDPMAHHLLGLQALSGKKFADALDHFRKANEKIPVWQEPMANAALALLGLGDKTAAKEKLERSLEINPADRLTHETLVGLLLADRQTDQAIEVLEKAIAKNPSLWNTANDLAYLLTERNRDRKDLDRALTLARQAVTLQPERAALNDTLGWVHYKRGEYAEAVAALEKAHKGEKQTPAILLYHLGMALHKSGRSAEARPMLEAALRSKDNFPGRTEAEALLSKAS